MIFIYYFLPTNLTLSPTHLFGFSKTNRYNIATTAIHAPAGTNRMINFGFWSRTYIYGRVCMCSTKTCEEDKRKNSQCEFFHTDKAVYIDLKLLFREFGKPDGLRGVVKGNTCRQAMLPASAKRKTS